MGLVDDGPEQVCQSDISVYFRANAVGDPIDDFRTVLRRVDMNAEWAFAERHVNNVNDGIGYIGHVGVAGPSGGESLHDVVAEMRIWTVVVFGLARLIYW